MRHWMPTPKIQRSQDQIRSGVAWIDLREIISLATRCAAKLGGSRGRSGSHKGEKTTRRLHRTQGGDEWMKRR